MNATTLSKRAQQLVARTNPEQALLRSLLIFAAQNPRFELANYGDLSSYHADARKVTKQLTEIKSLSWRFAGISNSALREASKRAFSGRLQFDETAGGCVVDYCTGQYWPCEYRLAALEVLKEALRIGDREFAAAAAA